MAGCSEPSPEVWDWQMGGMGGLSWPTCAGCNLPGVWHFCGSIQVGRAGGTWQFSSLHVLPGLQWCALCTVAPMDRPGRVVFCWKIWKGGDKVGLQSRCDQQGDCLPHGALILLEMHLSRRGGELVAQEEDVEMAEVEPLPLEVHWKIGSGFWGQGLTALRQCRPILQAIQGSAQHAARIAQ